MSGVELFVAEPCEVAVLVAAAPVVVLAVAPIAPSAAASIAVASK